MFFTIVMVHSMIVLSVKADRPIDFEGGFFLYTSKSALCAFNSTHDPGFNIIRRF